MDLAKCTTGLALKLPQGLWGVARANTSVDVYPKTILLLQDDVNVWQAAGQLVAFVATKELTHDM
jgi:hypothetical protein